MALDEGRIKEILLRHNYISSTDIINAEAAAKKQKVSIIDYLLLENFINKDLLGQAIAESYYLEYANLAANEVTSDELKKIPEKTAKEFRVIVFKFIENYEVVVTSDQPLMPDLQKTLKKIFPDLKISIRYSLPEDIDKQISRYRRPLETAITYITERHKRPAPLILDVIIKEGLTRRASDIHFEPRGNLVTVRYRVDGVMAETGQLPNDLYLAILNRLKIQSRLRLDEHFRPQDGSWSYVIGKYTYDLRISIIPTVIGEKTVIRILASYMSGLSLADVGLNTDHQKILSTLVYKPFGMILTSGPTGSGKTTTLYSLLKLINRPEVNITTIEDPVEYKMNGVNQIQVNNTTDLTFANGLRSIVRQDPDVILVGEIRDQETTEISVNASLTGHLLLSSFHANDAATTIPRLLEMGVEPFLLASALEVIIAQRLIRKICTNCRVSYEQPTKELASKLNIKPKFLSTEKNIRLYKGKGCGLCHGSGYWGRTAVFEVLVVNSELQDMILDRPSATTIRQWVSKNKWPTMFDDGLIKIKSGITTVEELQRVVEAPTNYH